MKRRGWTVFAGALLVALLTALTSLTPVPYVSLGPGPTVDTLGSVDGKPVINISGKPTTTSKGQLRLTTVGVDDKVTLLQAVWDYVDSDTAVVPREVVFPPNRTEKQVNEEHKQQFAQSQTTAEIAALRKVGYPVKVTVRELAAGLPAVGKLQVGDVIDTVDGEKVTSVSKLADLIRAKPPGTARTIGYTRGTTSATVTLTTAKGEDGKARIGVVSEAKQPHDFEVKFDLNNIGGPSAGLMFALGIVDKLTPDDLTGGLVIAGTGEIDDEGRVGPIGGIPQKLVAAKAAGAKAFLTPEANCAEALRNAQPGLPLVRVRTLDDGLAGLSALRENRQPELCKAP